MGCLGHDIPAREEMGKHHAITEHVHGEVSFVVGFHAEAERSHMILSAFTLQHPNINIYFYFQANDLIVDQLTLQLQKNVRS